MESEESGEQSPKLEILIVASLFPLGNIVGTPGALEALERTGQSALDFLVRHASGDWGELDEEDRAMNDWDLNHDGRLLSAYSLADRTRIWVITEYDRSATTVLLPEEY